MFSGRCPQSLSRAVGAIGFAHPTGANIATVAVARKLVVIAWHLLTKGEDYAFARPSLRREKLRCLELMLGSERHQGKRITPERIFASSRPHKLEREVAAQAEIAYLRLVKDWRPHGKKKGAGVPPGRASSSHLLSEEIAARQEDAPDPAL